MTGYSWQVTASILGLAWFAATNIVVSILCLGLGRLFRGEVQADVWRARRLLAVRLAPSVSSLTVVIALFLPAHLWLEPVNTDERIGVLPIALAASGLVLLLRSVWRGLGTLRSALRLAALRPRDGGRNATELLTEVPGVHGIALAGIFRPRILIGTGALQALTAAELDLAVAHERAHQCARDNLSRVLMYCAPDLLGWSRLARRLEVLWEAEAECLADAAAVAGSPLRATRLASALVKVARLAVVDRAWVPGWSMFHHPALLEARVRLLISDARITPVLAARGRTAAACGLIAVAAAWIGGVPQHLHWWTEHLLARLP